MKRKSLTGIIYLVAVVQLVAAWLGFTISQQYLIEPPGRMVRGGWEVFAAQHVAFERSNPKALGDVLQWLQVELGIRATLFSPDGRVIGSNHDPVPAPIPVAAAAQLPERDIQPSDDPNRYVVGIHDQGKLVAYVITDRFRFKRPLTKQVLFAASLLLLVFAGSLLFARSLVRPLKALRDTAKSFGAGNLSARARLQREDELGQVASAFDDMAERIQALLQSQRELLANVSHELRTPLARIRVALDLATDGDAAAARQALASITVDWGDLERLVEDVLATARLDFGASSTGGPLLRTDEVDLKAMADAVTVRYQIVYPEETLYTEVDENLPSVLADGGLLKRVLDNLIDNARKYSEPGNPVWLRMRPDGDGVVLEVEDHGMGIAEADLPHIFTPFFRADRSRNRKTGGVGLGLALVRRIVTAHGGKVDVRSAVGKGSTFRVSLARRTEARPASAVEGGVTRALAEGSPLGASAL